MASGVLVVALHDARALHAELADLAGRDLGAVLAHDLAAPAVAGHADCAHVVDVLEPQVHAARAHRLREAVVGVVVVMGEDLAPAADQALRDGLGADVHEAPLVQVVVGEPHRALLDGHEDVLRPRHEQPHDRAALVGDGLQHGLGRDAAQQHAAAAHHEAAEPVHARARVIERRDAQEHVVVGLAVVVLLHLGGLREALVVVQDRLGEARRAGGEVDRGVLVLAERDARVRRGAQARQLAVALRPGGAVVAHKEEQAPRLDALGDLLHAPDELRAKHEDVHVGLVQAVLDLVRGVAKVQAAPLWRRS